MLLHSTSTYLTLLPTLVQLGQCQQCFCRHIFIQDSKQERGHGRKEEIEEYHLPVVDHGGASEATEELIPEEQHDIALHTQNSPGK